jgi:hypothetical protein
MQSRSAGRRIGKALAAVAVALLLQPLHSVYAQLTLDLNSVTCTWPTVHGKLNATCNGKDTILGKSDIVIREGSRTVDTFALGTSYTEDRVRCSVAFVLDASTATAGSWNAAQKNAVLAYVDSMDGAIDEAAIISYSTGYSILQPVTKNKTVLQNAIGGLTAGGLHDIYDGMYAGIEEVSQGGTNSSKILIVVSSSFVPNGPHGTHTFAEVSQAARDNNVKIYGIGTGPGDIDHLALLSYRYYEYATPGSLTSQFLAIKSSITERNYFNTLSFRTEFCPDGSSRNLTVDVPVICGGSQASATFQLPRLPGMFKKTGFDIPQINAMGGQRFSIPVLLDTAIDGLEFPPVSVTIKFDPSKLSFVSASAQPGDLLEGLNFTWSSSPSKTIIDIDGLALPAGTGPLFHMEFDPYVPFDTLFTPIYLDALSFTGGCIDPLLSSGGVLIDVIPHPEITYIGSPRLCNGDSVTLCAPEGYATYAWSTGASSRTITVTSAGAYTVEVCTPSGRCGTSDPVDVTILPLPAPTIRGDGPLAFCEGKSVTLGIAGTAFYPSMLWSNGQVTESILVTQPGEYYVEVVDVNGCKGKSNIVVVSVHSNRIALGMPDSTWLCAGDTLTIDGGPGCVSYAWSTGDTTRSIAVTREGTYFLTAITEDGCIARSDTVNITETARPDPKIIADGRLDLCPGETLALRVSEEYAAYRWSTGETSRAIEVSKPGAYSIHVTNAQGCTATSDELVVTMPAVPMIRPAGPVVLCRGGRITLDAGSDYESYRWSTGATTRSIIVDTDGSFTVTTTLGRCTMTSPPVEVSIVDNLAPVISVEGDTVLCEGESVVLDGGDYLTWHWSTGETERKIVVAASGIYSVEVTDSLGCSGTSMPVRIVILPNPVPEITVIGERTICEGDTVDLDGGQGYAGYTWSTGATTRRISVTRRGSYSVTVYTEAGCRGTSDSVEINVLPAPPVPVITRNENVLESTAAHSYQWYRNGGPLAGATGRTLQADLTGVYQVRITNAEGCSNISEEVTVTITSMDGFSSNPTIRIYPEPNHGVVNLVVEGEHAVGLVVEVTNLFGQRVVESRAFPPTAAHHVRIDLQHTPVGLYMVRMTVGNHCSIRKIVRQ